MVLRSPGAATRLLALPAAFAMVVGLAAAPAPAMADDRCYGRGVSIERAIDIARGAGVARVKEVECDDGLWEVEGWTVNGREIEVEIDPRSGRIVDVEIDD